LQPLAWLGVAVALLSDHAKVNAWVAAVVGLAAGVIVCLGAKVDASPAAAGRR
jgi:hypothetical protein